MNDFLLCAQAIKDTLDNTFAGTLVAGFFLGYLGINQYRKQKKIDSDYERLGDLKTAAANVYSLVENAQKQFQAILNIQDSKNTQLAKFRESLEKHAIGHKVLENMKKELVELPGRLNPASDDLLSKIKMNEKVNFDTQLYMDGLAKFTLYAMATAITKLEQSDIETYRVDAQKACDTVQTQLKKILDSQI